MIPHALLGEFLGTFTLLTLTNGTAAGALLKHSKSENAGWLAITTGCFIAVVIAVFVAQSAGSPNADINPAVSLAKYWLGIYTLPQLLLTSGAQLLGAFTGAVVIWLTYLPHWSVTESPLVKLSVFATTPAIRNYPCNLLTEMIGAFMLVLGIGAIFGHATLGNPTVGMGPYLVGVLIWGIGLSLGGPTGYAINPARDLGPRIAHAILPIANKGSSDWSYAWIPILAPLVGASLGALVWHLVFTP